MKKRLIEHFKDEISITNINGQANIVTFVTSVKNIVNDFYKRSNIATDDIEQQKYRIIEAAARIIKNDIKCLPPGNSCQSLEELQSIPKCIEYLPSPLRLLLENVFVSKNSGKQIAFIGQSIMQQARPRALIMPHQVIVAIPMHHHFSSRYLIDSPNSMGFSSSYTEVIKFERNTAAFKGTDIDNLEDGAFIQFIADNVDHNGRTIDGFNTFHRMGIIASVTPTNNSANNISSMRSKVPRLTISSDEITKIGEIETSIFSTRHESCKQPKFEKLQLIHVTDPTKILVDLW